MSTDTLDIPEGFVAMTLPDEFAMRAPITFEQARDLWQHENSGAGPDLRRGTERRAFMAFWWTLRYEWAAVGLAIREEGPSDPGHQSPAEDRRLDRQLITLDWWNYRITKPLTAAGITTLRQLLALDVYQLDKIQGIGPAALPFIIDRLNREGLRLAPKAAAPADDLQVIGEEAIGT